MSEEIKKEAQNLEPNLDNLEQISGGEQVSGGGGMLEQLLTRIKADGHADELKTILQTQGKKAATAKCCKYYPEICGFAGVAVTML